MAVALYPAGETHARALTDQGQVDETSDWSFDAADGDAILGDPPDWDRYGSWHLGHDADQSRETKAAWSYPFGKQGKLYRSALRAIRSRASQQNETAIADAAGALLDALDAKTAQNRVQRPPAAAFARAGGAARPWYRFANAAEDPATVDVHIIDFIGDWIDDAFNKMDGVTLGVTARAFVDDLAKLPDAVRTLRVHINSPGGDVQGAVNIANALRDQTMSKGRRVETIVDGMAASAASIVMMAGQSVTVADNAIVMIHNPWTIALGDAGEMRKTAAVLDAVRGQIIRSYQWHSSLSAEALGALMDAETWLDADEAIAKGLATDKVAGLAAAGSLDPRALATLQVPARFQARVAALGPTPPAAADPIEVIAAVEAAGLGPALARELVAAKLPLADVQARLATATASRDATETRAREIRALCATAKLPGLADTLVASQLRLDDVRTHLATVTALLDRVEIDSHVSPDPNRTRGQVINIREVYAQRNGLVQ